MRSLLGSRLYAALLSIAAGVCQADNLKSPPDVIFDTDVYGDVDDVLALAMLHALQNRGEMKLVAVTVNTEAQWTASFVDLVNHFYGHGDVPVGLVKGGVAARKSDEKHFPNGINYTQAENLFRMVLTDRGQRRRNRPTDALSTVEHR
jgi:hypothetical protein